MNPFPVTWATSARTWVGASRMNSLWTDPFRAHLFRARPVRETRVTRRDERGLSESVQWVLVWPGVMMAIAAAIQTVLVLQARSVAIEAARAAVHADAMLGSTPSDAPRAASQVCAGSGVSQLHVHTDRHARIVRVDVDVQAARFFPAGRLTAVRAHAVAPKEGT